MDDDYEEEINPILRLVVRMMYVVVIF